MIIAFYYNVAVCILSYSRTKSLGIAILSSLTRLTLSS